MHRYTGRGGKRGELSITFGEGPHSAQRLNSQRGTAWTDFRVRKDERRAKDAISDCLCKTVEIEREGAQRVEKTGDGLPQMDFISSA
jgi:hypothetical protein